MKCDRCGEIVRVLQGSMFNTQMVCKSCLSIERKHPKYKEAREVERKQVLMGNYNYEGIGLPADLEVRK